VKNLTYPARPTLVCQSLVRTDFGIPAPPRFKGYIRLCADGHSESRAIKL